MFVGQHFFGLETLQQTAAHEGAQDATTQNGLYLGHSGGIDSNAEARCAEWLLNHAQRSESGVCSVQLQQRKRLIAAQLGIAPETLSRVLRTLRERSFISGSGRTVQLVDPTGLQSLAAG